MRTQGVGEQGAQEATATDQGKIKGREDGAEREGGARWGRAGTGTGHGEAWRLAGGLKGEGQTAGSDFILRISRWGRAGVEEDGV